MIVQGPELRTAILKFPITFEHGIQHFQLVLGPANFIANPGSKRQKLLLSFFNG